VEHHIWRALFENALEGMLLSTPEGRIVAANPAACRMLGRTEGELCTLDRSAIVVTDDAFGELLMRRDRDGHARGKATLRRNDGSSFVADVSSVLFDTADGPRVNVMVVDVTEQMRTHRALEILAQSGRVLGESLDVKETLNRLMTILVPELADICAIDIVEDDEIHRIVVAHRDPNKAELVRSIRRRGTENRAGVGHVIATGKPQLVPKVTDEFQRANTQSEEHYEEVNQLGVTSFVSVPLVARDRTLGAFTLASMGRITYDEYDLALAMALADQAALALDNARKHAAAVQATRLRDEVLGVVSHDLRNPLNTIKLSVGSLARRSNAEEIPVVRRAVQRAERLIQDLLLASKMDFTTIAIDRKPTNVRAIVEGVVALHKAVAALKGLDLSAQLDGDMTDVTIDRHRVAQMLDNLVGNAIKFTETGSVAVRARVDQAMLVVEVQDTGPGIAPEILAHVFDRFWQSAHAGRAGAGLGLAIARGIAQAHGGDITVDTAVGRGTTFTATLPIAAE
jgi:PAS domain S-box-containing protein